MDSEKLHEDQLKDQLIKEVLKIFKGSEVVDPNEPRPVRQFKNNVTPIKKYAKTKTEDDFGF